MGSFSQIPLFAFEIESGIYFVVASFSSFLDTSASKIQCNKKRAHLLQGGDGEPPAAQRATNNSQNHKDI